jgi:putative cardiolipin synthase
LIKNCYNFQKGSTIKKSLFFALFFTIFTFCACSRTHLTKSQIYQPQKSHKELIDTERDLLKSFQLHTKKLQESSFFYPLDEPRDAFSSRIFLIDNAKKSIDVQYYIYKDDASGAFFSYHLLEAANRGVKVRILIDDLDTSGKDKPWLLLASHPNVSLKVFNPIRFRGFLRFAKLALHIDSLGRRMHNKALIVDNAFSIIGGRNIGDTYYATGDKTLFLDFDILCAGKINHEIVEMFEKYWHSSVVEDADNILEASFTQEEMQKSRAALEQRVEQFLHTSIAAAMMQSHFIQSIESDSIKFVQADAMFFYDLPQKITTDIEDDTYHISKEIGREFENIKQSALIISPYFIPTRTMLEKFKILRKRGVEITVITNSLASTDVFIVYSGYQKHIKALLAMGVKVYELKPSSFARFKRSKKWIKQNRISLHTKLMILDERYLTIGSANIDPRSIKLNTETFMIIDSKELVEKLLREARLAINSDDFIEISWGEIPVPYALDGVKNYGIIYKTTQNGVPKVYYKPPYSSFLKIMGANIISYLPIEGYL